MKRVPLYSRTPDRTHAAAARALPGQTPSPDPDDDTADPPGWWSRTGQRTGSLIKRNERWAWALLALLLALVAGWPAWTRHERQLPTFEQIDHAMRESIAKEPLQSAAANAYEAVIGSVVRVVGEQPPGRPDPKEGEDRKSVGSGVVIVDKGIILTNLHVVHGASRIKVTYSNGMESEAQLITVQPE